jgi:hypothetical protein
VSRHEVLTTARWSLAAVYVVSLFATPVAAPALQNPYLIIPVTAEAAVGWVVAHRRPDNPMGWVFLGIAASAGLLQSAVALTVLADRHADPVPWWGVLGAWWGEIGWYPLSYLLTILTVLLYPSGLASPRWRPVLWVSLAALAAMMGASALTPQLPLTTAADGTVTRSVPNPLAERLPGLSERAQGSSIMAVCGWALLFCGLLAVASIVRRARTAGGVERLQLRWFTFAVVLLAAEIVAEPFLSGGGDHVQWLNLAEVVVLSFIPISCGVAILRYRLFEIDRIISRTTAYAVVTGLVLLTYLTVVTLSLRVLPGSSSFAVAAGTLTAAALFRPALRHVQHMVDHRFNRRRYDAEKVVDDFGRRLHTEIDGAAVVTAFLGAVDQTLQPSRLSLWLRGTS